MRGIGCVRRWPGAGLGFGMRCKSSHAVAAETGAAEVAGQETAAVASGVVPARAPKNAAALIKCYAQLGKARLTALVVASASSGFLLAGSPIDAKGLAAVTAGVAFQSFAANSFNQIYEIKTDALMNRTRARPLPAGRISRNHAAAFGIANAMAGTGLLAAFCNPVSAGLGVANIALYAGMYTPMKQLSVFNTHVGAVVGAIPPLIGYAAATGTLSVEAGILGAGLFFWQFPHFYALAYMYKQDYLAGNHKMMPCFDSTGAQTAGAMIRHSVALSTLPVLSYSLGITSVMFPIESVAFNTMLLYTSYKFKENPSTANARKVFKASLAYLPVFMGLMIFHKNGWSQEDHDSLTSTLPMPVLSSPTTSVQAVSNVGPNTPPAPEPLDKASGVAEPPIFRVPSKLKEPLGWIEDHLVRAKAYMKSKCIHEMIVRPPLSRVSQAPGKEVAALQPPAACPSTLLKNLR